MHLKRLFLSNKHSSNSDLVHRYNTKHTHARTLAHTHICVYIYIYTYIQGEVVSRIRVVRHKNMFMGPAGQESIMTVLAKDSSNLPDRPTYRGKVLWHCDEARLHPGTFRQSKFDIVAYFLYLFRTYLSVS
jgi:hypothetical protein